MPAHRVARLLLPVALFTVSALTLAGCGGSSDPVSGASPAAASPSAAAAISLVGTSWTLASYAEKNGTQVPAVPAAATLSFGADGVLAGSTGCNRIVGTYVQADSNLTIELGPMTKMACPPDVTAQENAVVANLARVASFTSGTSLVLATADGATLLTYSPGLTSLAGTSWQATGINNGRGGVEANAATSGVTAVFGEDGQLTGSGGCNSYSGTYTTAGTDQITLGPIAATAKACEDPDVTRVEQEYFAALGNVTTYQLDGDTLTLRDDSGAAQATFALAS